MGRSSAFFSLSEARIPRPCQHHTSATKIARNESNDFHTEVNCCAVACHVSNHDRTWNPMLEPHFTRTIELVNPRDDRSGRCGSVPKICETPSTVGPTTQTCRGRKTAGAHALGLLSAQIGPRSFLRATESARGDHDLPFTPSVCVAPSKWPKFGTQDLTDCEVAAPVSRDVRGIGKRTLGHQADKRTGLSMCYFTDERRRLLFGRGSESESGRIGRRGGILYGIYRTGQ